MIVGMYKKDLFLMACVVFMYSMKSKLRLKYLKKKGFLLTKRCKLAHENL